MYKDNLTAARARIDQLEKEKATLEWEIKVLNGSEKRKPKKPSLKWAIVIFLGACTIPISFGLFIADHRANLREVLQEPRPVQENNISLAKNYIQKTTTRGFTVLKSSCKKYSVTDWPVRCYWIEKDLFNGDLRERTKLIAETQALLFKDIKKGSK